MNNENLQRWALVAEITSGIAVVLSLIFVGFQIQQSSEETAMNTRALEATTYQNLIAQIESMNTLIIQDPEFADLYSRMLNRESPNNSIERQRIVTFITLSIRHGDMAFKQYQNKLIDQQSLDSVLTPLIVFLQTMEPAKPRWEQLKPALNTDYVSYVDELMRLGSPVQ
ncbi:MAG: hypothetical protein AB8B95_14810 [Pseudohongiellaceae bacterium]